MLRQSLALAATLTVLATPAPLAAQTVQERVDLTVDDLKQAATVIAFTAYHLANRDDPMPRKPARPATGGN